VYYALNGEYLQKSKVESIIPLIEEFTPSQVEIWAFPDAAAASQVFKQLSVLFAHESIVFKQLLMDETL
jgi:hypothetical protein